MADTTTGASATAGASGRSRTTTKKNGAGKHVDFRGLDLLLPPEAPGDLAFSIPDNELSEALRAALGDSQYDAVREKCKAEKLTFTQVVEAMTDLLTRCFEAWGLTEGE